MKKTVLALCMLLVGTTAWSQTIIIPVVFHVCYKDVPGNVPDSVLQHQLDVLNEDYNAMNPDIVNVPPVWQPVIGNMNILFTLATIDPLGNPTSGIERRDATSASDIHYYATGGLDMWPDTSYCNIWVTKLSPSGLLAYATFPGSTGIDGMDIDYRCVGRGENTQWYPYNRGRVATHELGHWFGLMHPWSSDTTNCPDGDTLADTPNCAFETYGYYAPGTIILDPCTPTAPGKMWQNFMDFTDDSAMCMFTQFQVTRMIWVMNNMRMGFLTPDGVDAVSELAKHSRYTVFPSPSANGIFQLNRTDAGEDAVVEVYDLQGRMIVTPMQFTTGNTMMLIDLSSYSNGTYSVIIRTANAVEYKRVVISR